MLGAPEKVAYNFKTLAYENPSVWIPNRVTVA